MKIKNRHGIKLKKTAALLVMAVTLAGQIRFPAALYADEINEEVSSNETEKAAVSENTGKEAPEETVPETTGEEKPTGTASENEPEEKPADKVSENAGGEETANTVSEDAVSGNTVSENAPEMISDNEIAAGSSVKVYDDDEKKILDDPNTTYIIRGTPGETHKKGHYFFVEKNCSSADKPLTIILENVNRTQEGEGPDDSFITIDAHNYVVIQLRGDNYIHAGTDNGKRAGVGRAAIHVNSTSTVKITSADGGDGSTLGKLVAYGDNDSVNWGGAAIGSCYNVMSGEIIIAGGTIEAHGGASAAGIGSGRDGEAREIKITGGNVTAWGGDYGAAIGAGNHAGLYDGGDLDNITITGGTVHAYGGYNAAGIGCSDGGHLKGTIRIAENANVEAVGGESGAGIGGGDDTEFNGGAKVLIEGGTIKATGGKYGAGIGGGNGGENTRVEINQTGDLSLEATGGKYGAGIGGGNSDADSVKVNLNGATITAKGGEGGAGIGSGDRINTIDISGKGTINAYGGENAAGIGGGNDSDVKNSLVICGDADKSAYNITRGNAPAGARPLTINAIASYGTDPDSGFHNEGAAIGSGKATNSDITIKNAVLKTRADEQGSDIGGGCYHNTAGGTVNSITIDNCDIESSSKRKVAPGIGAGFGGSVKNISITDSKYSGSGIGGSPMDTYSVTNLNAVDSIRITNSDIRADWDEEHPGYFDDPDPIHNFRWGPLDHGAAGIGSGLYGGIETIEITDSNIYAHGLGSGSGIGGGGAGGQSFSVVNPGKWAVGEVGTIRISRSHVEASSGCGEFTDMPPTTIDDGIKVYTINAIDFGTGAGIGSGSASSIGTLEISDCDYIKAWGCGGAGIGGGMETGVFESGKVGTISLKNIDKIEAHGGTSCAGIGTGGGQALDSSGGSLKKLSIENCKKVKAKGGRFGAGIGLGEMSRYDDGTGTYVITIKDSEIEARGGHCAAGIGGGSESFSTISTFGGENPPLLIEGACKIFAQGGDTDRSDGGETMYGGGAGIGGGDRGGCSTIKIALTEDETTPTGSIESHFSPNYYVFAEGGGGAAGIGNGGNDCMKGAFNGNSSDGDSIYIEGGAVFAKGGDSVEWKGVGYTGAGAGIGGSCAGSTIDYLKISGGYICAEAGRNSNENDKADDIGTGGNYADDGDRRENGILIISDGTVLADKIGVFERGARITGGSISGIVPNAVRYGTGNIPVYRTTLKLADNPQTKVALSNMTQEYGKDHIYTSPDRKLYLYLDRKGSISDKSQTADVTVGGDVRSYFGYTDKDHTGWLKMRGEKLQTHLESDDHQAIDTVRYLDDFCVALNDSRFISGDWTFTVSGNASLREEAGKTTSPGARAALNADMVGSYTVRGTSTASDEPEVYWGAYVDFTGQILKPDPEPVIVGVTSKVYDGRAAVGPEVGSKSGGEVTYKWFKEDGNTEISAPIDAGKYKVQAFVAETALFDEGKSEKVSYEIKKKDTHIVLSGSTKGTNTTLKANIDGIVAGYRLDNSAHVFLAATHENGNPEYYAGSNNIVGDHSGNYYADFIWQNVQVDFYNVRAEAYLYDNNYNDPPQVFQKFYKDKDERNINIDDVSATYGDQDITLAAATDHAGSSDTYRYEIISDSIKELNDRYNTSAKPTITLTPDSTDNKKATVSFNHAGTVKIKVTLSDNSVAPAYNPAEKIITVTVKPKELTAASYACRISDNSINPTPVREISYGQLSLFRYGISYNGLVKGDTAADFTHGYGTLSAITLPAKLSASDTGYQIDIRKNADPDKKVFYSRDYDIKYDVSTNAVRVRKAKLAVKAADASGEYGPREPDYEWEVASNQSEYGCDGLARWDSKDSVFITEPAVEYDKTAPSVNGREYGELDAGTYNKALKLDLKGAVSNNYDFVNISGNLVVKQADISNVMRFGVSTNELKYDGTPRNPDILLSDRFYETSDPKYKLSVSSDYVVNCPPEDERINAGTFTAVVKGIGNYTGERKVLCKITSDYYYNCTNGARGSWDIGSKDGFAITYKRNVNDNESRDHFLKLMIDGKEVDKASYDIASDSMTMTLKPDFLTGLGEGYHLFHPVFEDGESQMILFNIKQPGKPDTPVIPVDPVDPPAPPEPPGPPGPDKPDKPVNPDNPVDPKPDDEHDDNSSSDGGGGSMPAAGNGSVVFPNPIVVMDVTGITQAANKPAAKKPAAENAEPFLEGHGKLKGWDVISKSIEIAIKNKLKDPSVERIIMINMNGTSVVPANIFEEIKGQDVTLIFEMGDDIRWRVNGLDITEDVTEDIDFGVVVGTDEIPVDVVGDVLNDSFGVQLSLAHDGPFGFKATLLMELGEENGGKYANLFYYNEDKGELEFLTSDLIDEGGSTSLDFVHASEYVVAVSDKAMGDAVVKTVQTPGSSGQAKAEDNTKEAGGQGKAGIAKTEDTQKTGNVLFWWLIAAGLIIISAASGIYYVLRKR